jgi:hypothetical protein
MLFRTISGLGMTLGDKSMNRFEISFSQGPARHGMFFRKIVVYAATEQDAVGVFGKNYPEATLLHIEQVVVQTKYQAGEVVIDINRNILTNKPAGKSKLVKVLSTDPDTRSYLVTPCNNSGIVLDREDVYQLYEDSMTPSFKLL